MVQLRSDDPFDAPLIDAKYLTDAGGADLATLRSGCCCCCCSCPLHPAVKLMVSSTPCVSVTCSSACAVSCATLGRGG